MLSSWALFTGIEGPVATGGHRDPAGPQQAAVDDHVRLALSDVDGLGQGRGQGSEQHQPFADVAVDGRDADRETARQIRVRLAFSQVGHHEQSLPAGVQPPPPGPQFGAAAP
jgi:hypothetical protein